MTLDNNPIANIDSKVWAVQVYQPKPEHQVWYIDNQPLLGADVYTCVFYLLLSPVFLVLLVAWINWALRVLPFLMCIASAPPTELCTGSWRTQLHTRRSVPPPSIFMFLLRND